MIVPKCSLKEVATCTLQPKVRMAFDESQSILDCIKDVVSAPVPDLSAQVDPRVIAAHSSVHNICPIPARVQHILSTACRIHAEEHENGEEWRENVKDYDPPSFFLCYMDIECDESEKVHLLGRLAWTGLYALPELQRQGGTFVIHRHWRVAVLQAESMVFTTDLFPHDHIVNHFFDVFCRIVCGELFFGDLELEPVSTDDDSDKLPVGRLQDPRARQLWVLRHHMNRLLQQHDPWPTVAAEHVAFIDQPFNEYVLFVERRRRLRMCHDLIKTISYLFLLEAIEDRWSLPADATLIVQGNWTITLQSD